MPTHNIKSYDINYISLDYYNKSLVNNNTGILYKCKLNKEIIHEIAISLRLSLDALSFL